jgi:WG containing repeat
MRRLLPLLLLLVAVPVLAQGTDEPRFPFKAGSKGWGYLSANGKPAIAPQWQKAMPFSEGLAAVKRDNLWGYIGPDGKEVIAPQFASAGDFHDGRAQVEKRAGRFGGWIDTGGQLVLDAEKLDLVRGDDFTEGLALAIARSRLSGFIDPSGNWVVPAQLSTATRFSGGRAYVNQQDGKAGFIDKTGKLVIELPAKATTGFFHEDLVYVHQPDDKHVFLRPDGQVAFEVVVAADDRPAFGEFWERRAAFRAKDRWGFIDNEGKVVIKPKWAAVLPFSGGLAAVWDDKNRAGFIDTSGKLVIKPQFSEAQSFRDGLARVQHPNQKKGWVYINSKGKVVAKAE